MRKLLSLLLLLLLLFPVMAHAQAWSGILPASRATDWTQAGLPAKIYDGVPGGESTSNPWTPPTRTQCLPTVAAGTPFSAINSQIAGCAAGTYVLLAPGTFGVGETGALVITKNGVSLRGSGADQTAVKCTTTCSISMHNGAGQSGATWSSGFAAAGTTSITVASFNNTIIGQTVITLEGLGSNTTDTGGPWVCAAQFVCVSQNGSGTPQVYEDHLVVGCDGLTFPANIGHVCTSTASAVIISPGIMLPDFQLLNTPTVAYVNPSIGVGLEDMTIDCTGSTVNPCIAPNNLYASWFKGNRVINGPPGAEIDLTNTMNFLFSNNYFTQQQQFSETFDQHVAHSLNLFINNIFGAGGAFIQSPGVGDVIAFNLCRDAYTNRTANKDVNNTMSDHTPGYSLLLFESNECGNWQEDDVHGTANLNTFVRNILYGNDPPFVDTGTPIALQLLGPSRMENIIGNVMGNSLSASYKCTSTSCGSTPVVEIGGGGGAGTVPDALASTSAMFWGNWDIKTAQVRWCGNSSNTGWATTCASTTEVPQGMTGNAAPYNVTVPATQTLPLSFFMSGLSAGTSGTGLPFGKVCTNFNTATDTCGGTYHFSPMPLIGPDVTGGELNGNPPNAGFPNYAGFANHLPAYYAWKNLPVDTAYRTGPWTITNSSFSSGTETLTISGASWGTKLTSPSGEFTLTGTGCDGTYMMTSSTSTPSLQVQFAASVNPNCGTSGTMLWPNIRQFNEAVYQADPSGSASTPTFSPGAGTYTGTQTVTISTTTPGAILCWNTTGAPATNGLGTACITGTLINSTSGSITVSGNETVYAVAGAASLSDSSVGSASYTITNPTPPAPAVMFAAVPIPAQPPIPVLTLSTPTQSYVTANGFSQDGKTWNKSLTLTLTGTGFTSTTTCTFNGTSVPCVCGTATTCMATVPASMVPIPTKTAQYPISLSNPAVPAPILQ